MRRVRLGPLVTIIVATSALGACGDDSFTRDDAVARLRDAGVADASARCVVDALFDEVGFEELNVEREPIDEERDLVELAETGCADGSLSGSERREIRRLLSGS